MRRVKEKHEAYCIEVSSLSKSARENQTQDGKNVEAFRIGASEVRIGVGECQAKVRIFSLFGKLLFATHFSGSNLIPQLFLIFVG